MKYINNKNDELKELIKEHETKYKNLLETNKNQIETHKKEYEIRNKNLLDTHNKCVQRIDKLENK